MKFLTIVMVLLSAVAYADSSCDQMLSYGYPVVQVTTSNTILCRLAYVVNYSSVTKDPVYSAEYLRKENISTKLIRVNAFKADPDLSPGKRAELSDYNKAFDRGHMTPFEDVTVNSAAALQSFYLSNMCPQNLHLNRGLWRAIEDQTRAWAKGSSDGVYVITGPIFGDSPYTIGHNRVAVPSKFFKIVIDKQHTQAIAFIVSNFTPIHTKSLKPYVVTVHDVEVATHINFTPTLLDTSNSLKTTIGQEFLQSLK